MTKTLQSMMDHQWLRARKGMSSPSEQSNDSSQELCRHFSLADIRAVTKDFHKSFLVRNSDKVYKVLINVDGKGLVVAIKRFKKPLTVGDEIHPKKLLVLPNIFSPIGFCAKGDELILVHDYMANGSSQDYLHHTNTSLSWEMRLQICIGAAQGLEYLHANGEHIHHCIEPSSILLDENWVAQVMLSNIRTKTSDFASLLRSNSMHYNTEETLQYYSIHKVTDQNNMYQEDDLYSFGVTLLEVLISNGQLVIFLWEREHIHQKPKYYGVPEKYLLKEILQSENIHPVMHPHLRGKIGPECLREFVKISLSCLFLLETQRLSMDDVVRKLQFAAHLQENWKSLIASTTADPGSLLCLSHVWLAVGKAACGGVMVRPFLESSGSLGMRWRRLSPSGKVPRGGGYGSSSTLSLPLSSFTYRSTSFSASVR
ncbi:hypothetical protein Vadar_003494 [Vaccinium darrowii]|uniref:Uncharacterized protein n=1 Tax=Vaccinium darrowii TaxID=229202 RepID=A0ACB7YSQ1_9ERIC|nr:hypothetical protein Vadar_003494 [Vaccinium darrowii]